MPFAVLPVADVEVKPDTCPAQCRQGRRRLVQAAEDGQAPRRASDLLRSRNVLNSQTVPAVRGEVCP